MPMTRERRWSLSNASNSQFELWISIVTVVNVITFFTRPEVNPVHELVSPLDGIWAVMYALAGILIAVGVLRTKSANFEAAGMVLLIVGLAVQLVVFGTLGVASLNGTWGTLISLGSLAYLAIWRFRVILRTSRQLEKKEFSEREPE